MLIIFCAKNQIDQEAVNELVRRYDVAPPEEQDGIAVELEGLIGSWAKSNIKQKLHAFDLSPDELQSLSTEAILAGLAGVGRTRLRRTDIVPEVLIQQMQASEEGQRLWNLLSESLRSDLSSTTYVRADLSQRLIAELNTMLDHSMFADRMGWDIISKPSAIERSWENATWLASAFPEGILRVQKPEAHLMGFLSKSVIPNIANRIKSEQGAHSAETMKAWKSIQPIVHDLTALTGQTPSPEEVHAEYRKRLADQYGGNIRWLEDQIRQVQPDRAFKVKDARALADGIKVLVEHGYDKRMFEKGGQYYVPKEAAKPIGIATVQRLMATPGLGSARSMQDPKFMPAQVEPSAEPDIDVPQWAQQMGQEGRGGELYSAILAEIYPDPTSIQRLIGGFMADHPNPSQDEIDQFLASTGQRPDAKALLRRDWDSVVRAIDSAVVRSLGNERVMSLISDQLGLSPSKVEAMRDVLRRVVFSRATRAINRRYSLHG